MQEGTQNIEKEPNEDHVVQQKICYKKQAKKQAAKAAKKTLFNQETRDFSNYLFDYIWAKHKFVNSANNRIAIERLSAHIENEQKIRTFTQYMGNAVGVTQYLMREYLKHYFRFTVSLKNFKNDVKWLVTQWLKNRTNIFVKVIDMCAIIAEAFLYCDFRGNLNMQLHEASEWFEEWFNEISEEFYKKGGWKLFDTTCYCWYNSLFKFVESHMKEYDNVMYRKMNYDCCLIAVLNNFPVQFPIPSSAICNECVPEINESPVRNIVFLRPFVEAMNIISNKNSADVTTTPKFLKSLKKESPVINKSAERTIISPFKSSAKLNLKQSSPQQYENSDSEDADCMDSCEKKVFEVIPPECAKKSPVKLIRDYSTDLKSIKLLSRFKSQTVQNKQIFPENKENSPIKNNISNVNIENSRDSKNSTDITVKVFVSEKHTLKPSPHTLKREFYPEPKLSIDAIIQKINKDLTNYTSNYSKLKKFVKNEKGEKLIYTEDSLLKERNQTLKENTDQSLSESYSNISENSNFVKTFENDSIQIQTSVENKLSTETTEVDKDSRNNSCVKDKNPAVNVPIITITEVTPTEHFENPDQTSEISLKHLMPPAFFSEESNGNVFGGQLPSISQNVDAACKSIEMEDSSITLPREEDFLEVVSGDPQYKSTLSLLTVALPEPDTFVNFTSRIEEAVGREAVQPGQTEIYLLSEENSNSFETLHSELQKRKYVLKSEGLETLSPSSNLDKFYLDDLERKLKIMRFIETKFSYYLIGIPPKNEKKSSVNKIEAASKSPTNKSSKKKRRSKSKQGEDSQLPEKPAIRTQYSTTSV